MAVLAHLDVTLQYNRPAARRHLTEKEIVTKLNAKIVELAKNDDFKKKLWTVNAIVPVQTPEEMREFIETEIKANLELIKAAKVSIE